jgi:AraC-like DNA-binding protein
MTTTNHSITGAPHLISLRTISTQGGESFEWHSHDFDEFTLVTDDECMIKHPTGWRPTKPDTLLHYRAGERHGAIASPRQRPRFWVIHFAPNHYRRLTSLSAESAANRVWSLDPEQISTFQWLFRQLINERTVPRTHYHCAASAWLQLMLVHIQRWIERSGPRISPVPVDASAEVLRLWHLVNESVGKPNDELGALYGAANYDSVRHGFRKAFGCSPREMLLRLRMEYAKNLLLESALSIKEIAWRVGYVQPHDFNRLFHRHVGVAPSQWRTNPTVRPANESGTGRSDRGVSLLAS